MDDDAKVDHARVDHARVDHARVDAEVDDAEVDEPLTVDTFATRVNQPFVMHLSDERETELVLTRCTSETRPGGPAAFSLVFRGGVDAPAQQGTYLLSADGLNSAPVFLVPFRRLPDGLEYHAAFTQLEPPRPTPEAGTHE
jgi:hypothetical protein